MKYILTLAFVFAAFMAGAQGQVSEEQAVEPDMEEQAFHGRTVTRINKAELPEAVLRMVANGEFRRWDIEEAYSIHGGAARDDGQSSFIIVVSRRTDRFALYFGEDGKLIRQELMDIQETSSR